jgi:hypothetical protein
MHALMYRLQSSRCIASVSRRKLYFLKPCGFRKGTDSHGDAICWCLLCIARVRPKADNYVCRLCVDGRHCAWQTCGWLRPAGVLQTAMCLMVCHCRLGTLHKCNVVQCWVEVFFVFGSMELIEVSDGLPNLGFQQILGKMVLWKAKTAKVLVFRPHCGDCGVVSLDTFANSHFRQSVTTALGAGAVAPNCGEIPCLKLQC